MQQERAEGGQELRVGCGSDSHRVRARLRRALARCWVRHVDPDTGRASTRMPPTGDVTATASRRTNTGQWAVGRDWRVLWRLPHINGTQCPGLRGGMGLCGGSGARGDASKLGGYAPVEVASRACLIGRLSLLCRVVPRTRQDDARRPSTWEAAGSQLPERHRDPEILP